MKIQQRSWAKFGHRYASYGISHGSWQRWCQHLINLPCVGPLFFGAQGKLCLVSKMLLVCQVMVLSLHRDLHEQSQRIGYAVPIPDEIGPK